MDQEIKFKKRRDVYRLSLYFLLFFDILCLGYAFYLSAKNQIPDSIRLSSGETGTFSYEIPASASLSSEETNGSKSNVVETFSLNKPFSLNAGNGTGDYTLNSKLFGMLDLKETKVKVVSSKKVIPCGVPVGIYIKTEGLLVLDTQILSCQDGLNYEPAKNIVKPGDYILRINGKLVDTKEEFQEMVMDSGGKKVNLLLRRDGKRIKVSLNPVMTTDGVYRLGIWLRDDTQGLGTITYIDGDKFGALGHGINDYDTGTQMEIGGGSLYEARILSVQKGEKGNPGELVGQVQYGIGEYLGEVEVNGSEGIYGTVKCDISQITSMKPMEVAYKQDVKKGKAKLRIELDGKIHDYDIKILKVDGSDRNKKQGILFEITDKELLSKTGGVVQGMSGSPIIQDGKLVGAVTHVLVNDPTRGYGIFIENMLDAAG